MKVLLEEYALMERKTLQITNDSGASSADFKIAKDGLKQWMGSRDNLASYRKGTTAGLIAVRYSYSLASIREYGGTHTFEFHVRPMGGAVVQGPGLTGTRQTSMFKTPKKALKEIPKNSQWAYRGMSWEEWQSIRKSKAIKSRGGYNLGQEGLTFFTGNPGTGRSYASGFAPLMHMASKKRPGVIIAIPKKYTLTPKDRDDIPEGELAILGSLPMAKIKAVWIIVPVRSRVGSMELVRTTHLKYARGYDKPPTESYTWSEGSSSAPSLLTALVRLR